MKWGSKRSLTCSVSSTLVGPQVRGRDHSQLPDLTTSYMSLSGSVLLCWGLASLVIGGCISAADAGKVIDLVPGFALPHDHDVKAVVVGFDRHINYYKIQYATLCIRCRPRPCCACSPVCAVLDPAPMAMPNSGFENARAWVQQPVSSGLKETACGRLQGEQGLHVHRNEP